MAEPPAHGGDIWSFEGRTLLDFSASLHPLGMPPEVLHAAQAGVAASIHYPDPDCRALRAAIAQSEGVAAEQIVCGNGAAELLDRLLCALRPRRAMLFPPTFAEYERALCAAHCQTERIFLTPEREFDLSETHLQALHSELDLLILCNPNNPTGRAIPTELLEQLLCRCRARNIVLVVDESFLPLTDAAFQTDLRPWLARFPGLVLLRSLTKSYGMPGLRLGYLLCADPALRERVILCAQPWSVSLPAQWAGCAAMACPDWPERARRLVQRERPRLTAELMSLGFRVWQSNANFLLFYAPERMDLREQLLQQNILIRDCAGFSGLGQGYYRIAVRTRPENDVLLRALRQIMTEGSN